MPVTPEVLEKLITAIHNLVGHLEIAIGGIFGLYLIFFSIRAVRDRQSVYLLREIRDELRKLNVRRKK